MLFKQLLDLLYESVFAGTMKPSAHERMIFLCGVTMCWRHVNQVGEGASFDQVVAVTKQMEKEVSMFVDNELPKFHALYCDKCDPGTDNKESH